MILFFVVALFVFAAVLWFFVPGVQLSAVAPGLFVAALQLAAGLIMVDILVASRRRARTASIVGTALSGPLFSSTSDLAIIPHALLESLEKGASILNGARPQLKKAAQDYRDARLTYSAALDAEQIGALEQLAEKLDEIASITIPSDEKLDQWHALYRLCVFTREAIAATKRLPLNRRQRTKWRRWWRMALRDVGRLSAEWQLDDPKIQEQFLALRLFRDSLEDDEEESDNPATDGNASEGAPEAEAPRNEETLHP